MFHARVDPRTAAAAGTPLRLAVDPARFHFFDGASGENIALRREPGEDPTVSAPSVAQDLSAGTGGVQRGIQ